MLATDFDHCWALRVADEEPHVVRALQALITSVPGLRGQLERAGQRLRWGRHGEVALAGRDLAQITRLLAEELRSEAVQAVHVRRDATDFPPGLPRPPPVMPRQDYLTVVKAFWPGPWRTIMEPVPEPAWWDNPAVPMDAVWNPRLQQWEVPRLMPPGQDLMQLFVTLGDPIEDELNDSAEFVDVTCRPFPQRSRTRHAGSDELDTAVVNVYPRVLHLAGVVSEAAGNMFDVIRAFGRMP